MLSQFVLGLFLAISDVINLRHSSAPPVQGERLVLWFGCAATPEGPMGAVEHLKTLCCLGLKPESAVIAVTPLLHQIIPHGWTRMAFVEPDATLSHGYAENPAMTLHLERFLE